MKKYQISSILLALLLNALFVLSLYLYHIEQSKREVKQVEVSFLAQESQKQKSVLEGEEKALAKDLGEREEEAKNMKSLPQEPKPQPKSEKAKKEQTKKAKPQAKKLDKKVRVKQEPLVKQNVEKTVSLDDEREKAEAQAKEEQLRKELQAEKQQKEEISNNVSNAFRQKKDTQGSGAKDGVANAKGPSSSYNLSGRSIVNNGGVLVSPKINRGVRGQIVVKIIVDENGKVLKAERSRKGTNILDMAIIRETLKAAREIKFNSQKGRAEQSGTITYIFEKS